jgi:PBSX family phage portal protein
MPIRTRPAPVVKLARKQRSARNVRFISNECKGHTSEFDPLISTSAAEAVRKADLNTQQIADPYHYAFASFLPAAGLHPINPLYPFNALSKLIHRSNVLRQCIESYVVNIESYGHMLEYVGPEGQESSGAAQEEKRLLEAFLSSCSPTMTLRELRERSRWDLETMGNRFFEISRNLAGQVVMMDHLPGVTMFRTRREEKPIEVTIEIPNPANPKEMVRRTALRNFCRFMQMSMGVTSWKRVFFKEFGDPRPISPVTGEVDYSLPIEDQATEVMMLSLYTPGQVYGLPRWIGQLPSILGSRESEMVNLNFFRENAIPAMAVLISGGALTNESFQIIEDYINALRGQKAMQRILVLEASADDTQGSTDHALPAPKIDMKPMISERQQDGLFKDYDQACQQKVRSSFRLPPIYAGRAEDYTRASAFASMVTAENQIFAPERQGFDDIMNNRILKTYRPRFWRYKSMGVPLADPENLSKMLTTLDGTGALTPNAAIKIAKKVLDIQLDPITEDWGDFPFSAVMKYIEAGVEVPGLTKFIANLQMVKDAATAANAPPPAPVAPGSRPKSPGKKIKAVTKGDVEKISYNSIQDHWEKVAREQMRQEIATIAEEMRDAMIASVQVPAPRQSQHHAP